MHRQTYYRWLEKAIAAQERLLALELDWMRTRCTGVTLGPPVSLRLRRESQWVPKGVRRGRG